MQIMSKKLSMKEVFDQDIEKQAEEIKKDPEFQKSSDRILERIQAQINKRPSKKREVPQSFEDVTEKADQMQNTGSDGIGLGE